MVHCGALVVVNKLLIKRMCTVQWRSAAGEPQVLINVVNKRYAKLPHWLSAGRFITIILNYSSAFFSKVNTLKLDVCEHVRGSRQIRVELKCDPFSQIWIRTVSDTPNGTFPKCTGSISCIYLGGKAHGNHLKGRVWFKGRNLEGDWTNFLSITLISDFLSFAVNWAGWKQLEVSYR